MQDAIKARDSERANTLGLTLAALRARRRRISSGRLRQEEAPGAPAGAQAPAEAAEAFRAAGRDDQADQEERELDVIEEFMPDPIDEDELERIVDDAIAETARPRRDLAGDGGRDAAGRRPRRRLRGQPLGPEKLAKPRPGGRSGRWTRGSSRGRPAQRAPRALAVPRRGAPDRPVAQVRVLSSRIVSRMSRASRRYPSRPERSSGRRPIVALGLRAAPGRSQSDPGAFRHLSASSRTTRLAALASDAVTSSSDVQVQDRLIGPSARLRAGIRV